MSEGGTPLRSLFAEFFVKWDKKGLEEGEHGVDGLFEKLKELGEALAGGLIIEGLRELTSEVIEQGVQLLTTSEKLGIATEALQEWQYAGALSHVSTEDMNTGLRFLQRNLYEAANGGKEAAGVFTKLGVQVKDSHGELISTDGALNEIADRFHEMTNPIEKTALAVKLFGRGGQAMVPMLSRGSEGLAELREEFKALGGGLTDETIEASEEAEKSIKRLKTGVWGLVSNAMLPFIKATTVVTTKLKDWFLGFRQLSKGSDIVSAALIALGALAVSMVAPIIVAWLPLIATTLAWTAALAGAILIIDDLIGLFTGSKSVIGDWIDNLFGEGAAQEVVKTVKGWWAQLSAVLAEAREVGKGDFFADMKSTLHDISELVKAIVAGLKYINDWRTGKPLDKNWLDKLGDSLGLTGGPKNGGRAGVSGLPDHLDKGPAPFGEGGSFFPAVKPLDIRSPSTGDAAKIDEVLGSPAIPIGEQTTFISPTGIVAQPAILPAAPKFGEEARIQQYLNLTVTAEAKPDPNLVPTIRKVVDDANGQMLRDLAAGQ